MDATFPDILTQLAGAEDVLVLSHDRPDGDAVGSALAMGLLLESQGKRVSVVNHDPVPETLAFLPQVDRVLSPSEYAKRGPSPDVVVVLDSAGKDRIGKAVWEVVPDGVPLINIDHHVSNTKFGDFNLVNSASPATGQILFLLAESAEWSIDREVAALLYAAISTDTGSFRYPSTTADTMRIGGRLLELGVDAGKINQQLYESYPRRRVEAIRKLLPGLRFECDSRYASVKMPLSVTEELQLKTGDTEGVIDLIREIDSVVISVFYEELPNGRIRVSSRSKNPDYSVGDLCARFGGGGHTLAAGARLPGPIEEAEERFLAAVREVLG